MGKINKLSEWAQKHRPAIMSLAISFASLLVFAVFYENCGEIEIEKISSLSSPRNMATSPLAQRLIEEKMAAGSPSAEKKPDQETESTDALNETDLKAATRINLEPANQELKEDMVIIPKIGVTAPIVIADTTNNSQLHTLLDSGAVWYPDSAVFGAPGQTILLGHSAPANWPNIKHDTIFSRIIELAPGDEVLAVYKNKTYRYKVAGSNIIEKGGSVPSLGGGSSSLVLVSCWPPGRDLKRIAVEASLMKTE